ncbi:hypothetical protein [Cellulophaga sp. BC115SP]|nr:hypothetical protein [Cellulophaga sp. BC115SP]
MLKLLNGCLYDFAKQSFNNRLAYLIDARMGLKVTDKNGKTF